MMINLIEAFIGLASGLAVGAGFVAFLTVLGIIPRLVQLSKSHRYIPKYETSVISGSLFGTLLSFSSIVFHVPIIIEMVWGLFHGIFIGMLAAALTEVLNVFPILAKRIGMDGQILVFLMAIVLGKIFGSLFQWVIFVK
ncbi:stage V sporulation protein AB [Salinibacillus xinjiangensis]|uniref:Stage V sporulation protein AB n=1 Tax=Salinibacillus xinjiangensis TaxID=1229268 RepID=A0A6G1X699_9BACI|nr:stage V sporulation protein AB [Salinibacillus xinjiangensis]MRG86467.1 stage V sporulation protein AB [Salinibacillus xinjiangensis]